MQMVFIPPELLTGCGSRWVVQYADVSRLQLVALRDRQS